MLWLLLACNEYGLRRADPGPPAVIVPQVERFVQAPLPAVDLLFVVDGTPSMAQERAELRDAIGGLLGTLDADGLDWQVGVVSADATEPWGGWLRGTPYVLTAVHPDPLGAFAARLPKDEAGGEEGLAAAVAALEGATTSGPNAGFLRPGSRLHVVFVSDADDDSTELLADPVGDFLDALATFGGPDATAHAVVGDVPDGCVSITGTAQAGLRYVQVAQATGGEVGSICQIDFGALFAALAHGGYALSRRFELRTDAARNLRVLVDDEEEEGWVLEGNILLFDVPPAAGAVIEVRYVIVEGAEP